jgi:hypothetical protein
MLSVMSDAVIAPNPLMMLPFMVPMLLIVWLIFFR